MTSTAPMLDVVRLLAVQFAAFQAVLLLVSGVHKLIRPERLRTAAHEFAGVPRRFAPFALGVVALAELLACLLLWTPSYRGVGGALAALIWGLYLALILRAIAQGRRNVDCGCTFGVAQHPLGLFQVSRNALLAGMAFLVTAESAAGGAGPIIASQILAAFALLALYGALDQVMALMPPRGGELL